MPRRFVKSQHPGDMGGRWVEDEYQAGAEGGRQATQMSEREIKRMIEESRQRQELMRAAEEAVPASVPDWKTEAEVADRQMEQMLANLSFREPEWQREARKADRQAQEMIDNLSFRGGTRQEPDWRRSGREADRRVEEVLSGLGGTAPESPQEPVDVGSIMAEEVPSDPFDIGAVMTEPVGGDSIPDAVAEDVEKGPAVAGQGYDSLDGLPYRGAQGDFLDSTGRPIQEEGGWRAPMLRPDEGPSYPELPAGILREDVPFSLAGSGYESEEKPSLPNLYAMGMGGHPLDPHGGERPPAQQDFPTLRQTQDEWEFGSRAGEGAVQIPKPFEVEEVIAPSPAQQDFPTLRPTQDEWEGGESVGGGIPEGYSDFLYRYPLGQEEEFDISRPIGTIGETGEDVQLIESTLRDSRVVDSKTEQLPDGRWQTRLTYLWPDGSTHTGTSISKMRQLSRSGAREQAATKKNMAGGMASGGIIGLAGGGYVPMVYYNGGYIPAYGLGGFLKKLGKGILKVAPVAASFIPGIGPLAAGAIGGVSGALSKKLEGGSWGDALSKGVMTGMGSYAGRKGVMGAKEGWEGAEGGFGAKLEGAFGGLKDQFSMEDVMKMAPMLAAGEAMGQGHAGGAAGPASGRISTVGAGGGGGRPAGGGPMTDVSAPTSQVYNLFSHLPQNKAQGGYVDNLYAARRFGGGPVVPQYGFGGFLRGLGKVGTIQGQRPRSGAFGGIGAKGLQSLLKGKKVKGKGGSAGKFQKGIRSRPTPKMEMDYYDPALAEELGKAEGEEDMVPAMPATPMPPPQTGVPQVQVDPSLVPNVEDLQLPPQVAQPAVQPPPPPVAPPPQMAEDLPIGMEDVIPQTVAARTPPPPQVAPPPPPVAPPSPPMQEEPPMGTEGRRGPPEREAFIHEAPLVEPDMDDIEEALPATTGFNPATGTGYVPPGGIPEEPAQVQAPAQSSVPQLSQAARDELANRGYTEGTDADLIRIAAQEGIPMQGFEGGLQAGVGPDSDVSKPGTMAIRKDEDTGMLADYQPQGDQGSYGVDYTSPLDNPLVADLGDEIASAGTRTSVGTTSSAQGTVTDPGEQEGTGKREKAVADKQKQQDEIIKKNPAAPWTDPDWTMPPPSPGPTGGPTNFPHTTAPPPGGPPPGPPQGPPPPTGPTRVMPTAPQGGQGTLGNLFESSGHNPFSMPTTAAQFTAAGDQGTADMLNRINAPAAPVESYVPARQAGGLVEAGAPVEGVPAGGQPSILDELAEDEVGQQVLQQVIEALQDPENPESAETLQGFEEAFPGELENLMAQLGGAEETIPMQAGGLIPGSGDAMADDRLGIVNPGKPDSYPILTSDGEYVVAGDVVAGLGSGNSKRGEAVLDQLQDNVRLARTGNAQQPPPIDLTAVLPKTYGQMDV